MLELLTSDYSLYKINPFIMSPKLSVLGFEASQCGFAGTHCVAFQLQNILKCEINLAI